MLRATPRLFGLDPVVASLYHAPPEPKRSGGVHRPGKAGVTFPDAPGSVRLSIRAEGRFPRAGGRFGPEKLPDPLRDTLKAALAPAA
ncbi:MAG: hypothetical protein JWN86_204 [Planctomycetota bacterium]|nr:hypothetical protein [Planctomycetota bacterium]